MKTERQGPLSQLRNDPRRGEGDHARLRKTLYEFVIRSVARA